MFANVPVGIQASSLADEAFLGHSFLEGTAALSREVSPNQGGAALLTMKSLLLAHIFALTIQRKSFCFLVEKEKKPSTTVFLVVLNLPFAT